MKTYIIEVIGAAILAIFADILSPAGWKKYMGIITGIILLTVIVTPVFNLSGVDVLSGYRDSDAVLEKGDELYGDMLKNEFSKSIAMDIKERIRQEFSTDTIVEVEVEINERGNIDRISKITLFGKGLNEKIAERISFIYDVDEVVINAG